MIHRVTIHWEEEDPLYGPCEHDYTFQTRDQLDMFMYGVAEACARSYVEYKVTYDSRESSQCAMQITSTSGE